MHPALPRTAEARPSTKARGALSYVEGRKRGGPLAFRGCVATAVAFIGIIWLAATGLGLRAADAEQEAKLGPARSVWDGVYTAQQAERGRAEYLRSCASCHAEDLRGKGTAPGLVEESFTFQWEEMTVGDLFVRMRALMPSDRPNSLPAQAYRDIVAFILQSNAFPSGMDELDADPDTLRRVLITTKRPEK